MGGWGGVGVSVSIATVLLAGCATAPPMQRVRLELAPAPVVLFVDGERRETEATPGEDAATIALRSDTPHVLYVKRDGYRPERVVLTSESVDGVPQLRPQRVVVRLELLTPVRRELSVELDARSE